MKRVTLGLVILVSTAAIIVGCKKREPDVAPEPDTEVQTALDATWATYVMTDIDMMCSFMGENQLLSHFYTEVPGSGTMTAVRNISSKSLSMSFFNTRCIDGRLRNGTVYMDYKYDPLNNPNANPNSEYYHEFGFAGKISLLNYRIDGWIVTQFNDAVPGYVYNLLETNQYDPKVITLKWKIAGKYKFIHPTDSTKNIVWDGSIIKTLTNTNDPKVFSKAKNPVITWSLATVSYSGQVTGMTNSVVPYTMKIEQTNQVVRTFTCYPDKIAGVSITPQGTLSTRYEEHHPFVSGIASFTTSNKYPRQIYFGNEGNADLSTQCDNTGEILIKGISYRVNFIK